MMLPPIIRVGPVPVEVIRPKVDFVVLTEHGWRIVVWADTVRCWHDLAHDVPAGTRYLPPDAVLCWMPGDGT